MKRKLNLKVGQKVAIKIERMSNASRGMKMSLENIDAWCFEGEVTKVGRKYITVLFNESTRQFDMEDDYREKYTYGGADYKLYLNKEEVIEEHRANKLHATIGLHFSSHKTSTLTVDQLERILGIIKE